MALLPASELRPITVQRRLMINHPHAESTRVRVLQELAGLFEAQHKVPLPKSWIRYRIDEDELPPMTWEEREYAGETYRHVYNYQTDTYEVQPPPEFNEYGTMHAWIEPPPLPPGAGGWDLDTGKPTR